MKHLNPINEEVRPMTRNQFHDRVLKQYIYRHETNYTLDQINSMKSEDLESAVKEIKEKKLKYNPVHPGKANRFDKIVHSMKASEK